MSTYAKSVASLGLGLALFLVGYFLHEPDLRLLGYGAIAASPLVFAVRNNPPLPAPTQFDSEPPAHPEGATKLP